MSFLRSIQEVFLPRPTEKRDPIKEAWAILNAPDLLKREEFLLSSFYKTVLSARRVIFERDWKSFSDESGRKIFGIPLKGVKTAEDLQKIVSGENTAAGTAPFQVQHLLKELFNVPSCFSEHKEQVFLCVRPEDLPPERLALFKNLAKPTPLHPGRVVWRHPGAGKQPRLSP